MFYSRFSCRMVAAAIVSAAALGGVAGANLARADIFVANNTSGTVGEYSNSGATINASFATGLGHTTGLAVSGSHLFVGALQSVLSASIDEYSTSGTTVASPLLGSLRGDMPLAISGQNLFYGESSSSAIGEYNLADSTNNASFISGLDGGPYALAVSGSDIFVSDMYNGDFAIGEYATSGSVVNPDLITLTDSPFGIAVSGGDIFVSNGADNSATGSGSISEYTTSGQLVNASLITGLNEPYGLAVSGSDIFVANHGTGTIGEYTTSGSTVDASLVTGLSGPFGIVVTPEPASLAIMGMASVGALLFGRRRIMAK